ncbi:MAG: RNA polymerase sigma-70 factor [Bacteroidota bacterium]
MAADELNINRPFDESEFEMLFKLHFKPLCFLAQRYVKDLDMAREIVQESFMALWDKRETIDASKAVKSYLSTVVYNKSLNYLRSAKKFDKELLISEHLMGDPTGEYTDILVVKDIQAKIDLAMEELPEKCREIFMMNRYEHLKYQEIADKLQISVKTVEAQMSKALQRMRISLAEYLTWGVIILYFLKK